MKPLAARNSPFYHGQMVMVITLLIAGTFLILAETILPGLVAGIAGTICLIAAVAVSYQDFGAPTGHIVLLLVVVGSIIGFMLWLKYFPDSRVAALYISKGQTGGLDTNRPELLDKTGIAKSALRPSGTALIDGERVDVITEGGLIEPGTPVKVVAVEGLRVVVRAE